MTVPMIPDCYESDWQLARGLSESEIIPKVFHKKPADCFLVIGVAKTLGISLLQAFSSVYVLGGKVGIDAKLMIGLANHSGVFSEPIDFKVEGEGKEIRATAFTKLAATGRDVSVTISWRTAELEGWTRNPKYLSMPEQMLKYRAATFLTRLYCPEVLAGLQTQHEVEDVAHAVRQPLKSRLQQLNAQITKQGVAK